MRPRIAVLDYGMGNLRSVARALSAVGAEPVVTTEPEAVDAADALVIPGVGAFGACVAGIRRAGLEAPILAFASSGRPTLGVCLGMQVLFEGSEEGGGPGLGVFRGEVRRLPATVKVPHMGWNRVAWTGTHPLLAGIQDGTWFYFVHSYACVPDEDVVTGEAEHGVRFAAAVARGAVVGVQFHPEKSGDAGLALYRNLVEVAA